MADANYVLLEKITVGAAGASSVTFSNIPQTGYTDLVVRLSARSNAASTVDWGKISFNGSTASFTSRDIFGDGSSVTSLTNTHFGGLLDGNNATASTFGNTEYYIPNYTSANNKSVSIDSISENNSATGSYTHLDAVLWSNTAAITSIGIAPNGGTTWLANSTFYLYGVAKLGTTPAIVPYATGGDTIMTDGTYWYHTFLSSGTFTPQKAITCDYLVVAGGGGGGSYVSSGGGGAGGLRSTVTATGGGGSLESKLSLGTSAYTVTIGAGGSGQIGATQSVNGSNSVFSTITATGGGGGGGYTSAFYASKNGGSGGGGPYAVTPSGGTGTANQGYAGGNGIAGSPNDAGGGGGGAGAVGANATTSAAGNGGNGVAVSITGSSVTYAGGGGGSIYPAGTAGTGGSGGGGNGVVGLSGSGSNGTANTGGGGGSSASGNVPPTVNGGNGGSGIVVIRYEV